MSKYIKIQEPVWKDRSVGVANYNLIGVGRIFVEILHKDKFGNRSFPNTLVMDNEKARTYPTQQVSHTVTVHRIPIKDFEELARDPISVVGEGTNVVPAV